MRDAKCRWDNNSEHIIVPSTPHPTTAMYSSSVEEEPVVEDDAIAAENRDQGGGIRWRSNIGEDGIEEKHVDDATDDNMVIEEEGGQV